MPFPWRLLAIVLRLRRGQSLSDEVVRVCEHEDARGRTFNIGSSTPIAVLALARRVIARAGSSSGIALVPYEAAYGDGFEELGARGADTAALR